MTNNIKGFMGVGILKYLNFRRIFNLLKVFTGYYLSILVSKSFVWGKPAAISIEPTNYCNLQCPECPSGSGSLTRETGTMQFTKFREVIDQCHKETFYLQLFFQGEPFLNPDLFRMIDYARQKKIFISISTNGHFIEKNIDQIIKSPPDKLIISADGLDEASYQLYRKGGSFRKVEEGLDLLSTRKKKSGNRIPFIEFQFIVMRQNEHFLESIYKYAREKGVNKVALKTMHISNPENIQRFLPENVKYMRYARSPDLLRPKHHLRNRCFLLWKTAVITWDGLMVPCCFDKDAKYKIGTLNGKTMLDIWFSAEFNLFRESVLTNRKSIDICTNCTQGTKAVFR